ncbi:uncharacterized protein LOC117648206 isoform X2 [Thrips palmi]|uniref:Uncharacterized protein LOC117648206 isoform X2 n=1 Tax=Thrips palmi TaxID=161013 RepID=A0A6P8Z1U1_THRPL|nr:uncharacterized protein LOC117648206 isoform X2 [Thrips palmi]XP_034246460.1 uncharacterized protein LOC117648206 isoform X2 [Thrips palmi]XP_034246461.1 uncharacterized protein LOC117648206 isoform X2 [Thrips palmi]XP_034246462.1 uncharacterized protein LOC117648206 isoform X2 [Thrips palmi]XP_034246463.1 uncharacterized protein LOC117648206 isoform X2 [Thrips palmi]XP_034246464.1 uncharacterized protein LOC117648206 isoform X2 [Thrips palmi]
MDHSAEQSELDSLELNGSSAASSLTPPAKKLCTLPDDELLQVFGFLTREQLLKCRTVCRRFRQLTLHPALWRRMNLLNPSWSALGAATLRVAPCLRRLTVSNLDELVLLGTLLAASSCAVSELHVVLDVVDAVLVAVVLARQATLGRLKEVKLTVTSTNVDAKSFLPRLRQLLRQLLSTPGLESIELDLDVKTAALLETLALNAVKRAVPVPSSLRRLQYFSACKDPYLPLFLEWHAATLEVVKLRCGHPRAAPMLAAMPRLRELQCPVLKDMPALLACTELRSLRLSISKDESPRHLFPGVAEYLRSAVATIEDLVLDYFQDEGRAQAVDLVLSLAGQRRTTPALKSLRFVFRNDMEQLIFTEPQPQLRPLAAVVHRLKHLVSLNIGQFSDELLDALDGEFVPNLERLEVSYRDECPHEWIHEEHVKELMQRCPRLHILAVVPEGCCIEGCTFCTENKCHEDLDLAGDFTLFSHPKEASCGVEHDDIEILIS